MASITISTFNAENLFSRYKFRGRRVRKPAPPGSNKRFIYERVPYTPKELAQAVADGFIIDRNAFKRTLADSRTLTADAIKATDADIIGLQEIENLDVLKYFNSNYLKRKKYPYQYLIDANDPRFIDVGILSRYPVTSLHTHQFRKHGRGKVFSRDCLEAQFDINGKNFGLFVNHLKSMLGGRGNTKQRRLNQSNAILAILKARYGNKINQANFALVGDFNDYVETGELSKSGIAPLMRARFLDNVVERLPADERWTHFYGRNKTYHQLDYVFLSKALADKNPNVLPVIERRGQPLRVNPKNGPKVVKKFFAGIKDKLKASDHCPVSIKVTI